MNNDHLWTSATYLSPKDGRCTQVWLYLQQTINLSQFNNKNQMITLSIDHIKQFLLYDLFHLQFWNPSDIVACVWSQSNWISSSYCRIPFASNRCIQGSPIIGNNFQSRKILWRFNIEAYLGFVDVFNQIFILLLEQQFKRFVLHIINCLCRNCWRFDIESRNNT